MKNLHLHHRLRFHRILSEEGFNKWLKDGSQIVEGLNKEIDAELNEQ